MTMGEWQGWMVLGLILRPWVLPLELLDIFRVGREG